MSDELLTPQQEIALLAMLGGEHQKSAAAAAGVSEGTLSRWMNDPDHLFYRMYVLKKESMRQAFEARIIRLVDRAFAVVERSMLPIEYVGNEQYSPNVALDAAKVVFKMAGLLPTSSRITAFGKAQINLAEQQVNITGEGRLP